MLRHHHHHQTSSSHKQQSSNKNENNNSIDDNDDEEVINRRNNKELAARRQRRRRNNRKNNNDSVIMICSTKVLAIILTLVLFVTIALNYSVKSQESKTATALVARAKALLRARKRAKGSASNNNNNQRPTTTAIADGGFSAAEDAALELNPSDQTRLHLVFSTDCSPYQHWQSYLLYYSAMKAKQPGHVTRIASGCTPEEAHEVQTWFDDNISIMSKNRFHLHLTPQFSHVMDGDGNTVGNYKFFNKPFGLRHWMEHSPQLKIMKKTDKKKHHVDSSSTSFFANTEDDIVILIDPDMVLLRPIVANFDNERETIIGKRKKAKPPFESLRVQHGKPFAQTYGLGAQWRTFHLDNIAGSDSPAKTVSKEQANLYYAAGPPYLATVQDMYRLVQKWTEFVPKVYEEYPHLLGEMYAYCIAAAHLGLQHKLIDSLMVSNTDIGTNGEGWPLVDDQIEMYEMCHVASHPNHTQHPVPSVVHMCQRYMIGEDWFFGKRRVPPQDVFSCDAPMLQEPPGNVAILYDWKKPPGATEKQQLSPKQVGRETFMVCALIGMVNEAATFYKKNACAPGMANLDKTMRMHLWPQS